MKKYIKDNFEFFPIIEAIISTQKIALKYFNQNKVAEFSLKEDTSPVTKADLEINQHLKEAIQKHYPNSFILSEENSLESNIEALLQDHVFIIDPIDGTSAFVKGSTEFTVNIALKIKQDLVLGAIYFPYDDLLYYTENDRLFKFENAATDNIKICEISDKKNIRNKLIVIATRREDELLEIKDFFAKKKITNIEFISLASSAKFCYLVEGKADVYLRAARIKLWDVAAGFAIVKAGGYKITDHANNDLLLKILDKNYVANMQKEQFRIDPFVIKKSKMLFL